METLRTRVDSFYETAITRELLIGAENIPIDMQLSQEPFLMIRDQPYFEEILVAIMGRITPITPNSPLSITDIQDERLYYGITTAASTLKDYCDYIKGKLTANSPLSREANMWPIYSIEFDFLRIVGELDNEGRITPSANMNLRNQIMRDWPTDRPLPYGETQTYLYLLLRKIESTLLTIENGREPSIIVHSSIDPI